MTTSHDTRPAHASEYQNSSYGYAVAAGAFIIMAVKRRVTFHAFGIFFKSMVAEFGWTRAETSGAFSLSLLISGFSAILMGRLTDKFGPRLVVTLCGLLMGLGYIIICWVTALWQLYLLYGLIIGIAMGGSWVPLMSTVARWFVARRTMIMGIVLAGLGIGGFIGPIAEWLISITDWRTSYLIIGIIGLVVNQGYPRFDSL